MVDLSNSPKTADGIPTGTNTVYLGSSASRQQQLSDAPEEDDPFEGTYKVASLHVYIDMSCLYVYMQRV